MENRVSRPVPTAALRIIGTLLLIMTSVWTLAEEKTQSYQSRETFLKQVFDGIPPAAKVVWISGSLRASLKRALGHEPDALRIRYWQQDKRSAWVLEEIGKTRPITAGVVIENGTILTLKVLTFRESRGWEIKHDFFTRQFKHLGLTQKQKLDAPIDGITGATLSVNAMRRVARAALILDQAIHAQNR